MATVATVATMDAMMHANQSLTEETMHPIGQCIKDTAVKAVTEFLSLFYIMSPYETSKEDAYDVPDYEVVVSAGAVGIALVTIIVTVAVHSTDIDISRL